MKWTEAEIQPMLRLIEKQIGLKLELCDYFTGIRTLGEKVYFNVILREKTSESKDYALLESFSKKYQLISVEPNGVNRVSIIQNIL